MPDTRPSSPLNRYAVMHTYYPAVEIVDGRVESATAEGVCVYLQLLYEHISHPAIPEVVEPDFAAAFLIAAYGFTRPAAASDRAADYELNLHLNWEQYVVPDVADGNGPLASNAYASAANVRAALDLVLSFYNVPDDAVSRRLTAMRDGVQPIALDDPWDSDPTRTHIGADGRVRWGVSAVDSNDDA